MEINTVRWKYARNSSKYIALFSDTHIANPYHNRELLQEELEEAKELDAKILLNGDIVDALLHGDRKRFNMSSGTYGNVDNALNRMIEEAVDVLSPFANNIVMIGIGNHETAVIKHHSFDIIQELVKNLNDKRTEQIEEPIVHGGYEGFFCFKFKMSSTAGRCSYKIYYSHGQGGAAPVTQGAIDLVRKQFAEADVIWLGHKHNKLAHFYPHISVNQKMDKIISRPIIGVVTACYLNNIHQYDIKESGYKLDFSEEKMMVPSSQGNAIIWLKFGDGVLKKHRIIL